MSDELFCECGHRIDKHGWAACLEKCDDGEFCRCENTPEAFVSEARRVARLWFRRAQATEEKLKIAVDALESIQHGVIASCDHAANERILMRAASEALQQIGGEK